MDWTPSRVALAAITTCVVVGGVGAGTLLQPANDRHPPEARGRNVSITVVAPPEPVPDPGGVMDVGDLVDDYRHRDHARDAVLDRPADLFIDDYPLAPAVPRRAESPGEIAPGPAPAPVIVERRERLSRWPFGLDQPRPDGAAERRERMARMDEAERMAERFDERDVYPEPREDRGRDAWRDGERRERERQWYRSDGRPVPEPR